MRYVGQDTFELNSEHPRVNPIEEDRFVDFAGNSISAIHSNRHLINLRDYTKVASKPTNLPAIQHQ